MERSDPVSFDQIILIWLRSEWDMLRWAQFGVDKESYRYLIALGSDLADPTQNSMRLELLRSERAPLIDPLPSQPAAWHVLITEADLPNLFTVRSSDWQAVTHGTFRLDVAAQFVQPGTGGHYAKVESKSEYLRDYNAETTEENIILISASENGPFTIIDGNHRAIFLYQNLGRESSLPWKGILIQDARVEGYLFLNH